MPNKYNRRYQQSNLMTRKNRMGFELSSSGYPVYCGQFLAKGLFGGKLSYNLLYPGDPAVLKRDAEGKLSYNLLDQFSLIGGLGYNLVGIGANAGLQYSVPSEKQTSFYFTGMYGHNSVIIMKNGMSGGGAYSGKSFGIGLKINSLRSDGNFWDVGILAPTRSQKYKDAIQEMKRSPYILIESEPWLVLFFVGYNFNIGTR